MCKIIDRDTLLERCMGQRAIMQSVLTKFRECAEDILRQIEVNVEQRQWQGVSSRAHTLKGAARGIAAEHLGDLAEAMERNARLGDSDACRELETQLQHEFHQCLEEIIAILHESKGAHKTDV